MRSVRVSAASTSARWGRIDANLAKITAAAERAADQNARLLLLPECCLTGADWPTGVATPRVDVVALALDSPPVDQVVRLARRTHLVIAFGLYERHRGRVHMSQALAGPRGVTGVYRKVHEGRRSSRDRELFPVFDLGFVRVGISLCRDNMLPECARILALRGAEVVLAPFTSLPLSRRAWRLQRLVPLRARAQDSHVFVLSASHARPHVAGKPPEWGYSGVCCAVDPLGRVIAESKGRVGRPQHVTVRLDAALLHTYVLADQPAIRTRRPRAYAALVSDTVQRDYVKNAPLFEMNLTRDLRAARR